VLRVRLRPPVCEMLPLAVLLPGLPEETSELIETSTGGGAESSIIMTACRRLAPAPELKASSALVTGAVDENLCRSVVGVLGKATRDLDALGSWCVGR